MTAAERSELAEIRQELGQFRLDVTARFDSVDTRLQSVEIAKAVQEALAERQAKVDALAMESRRVMRERSLSKAQIRLGGLAIAASLVIGLAGLVSAHPALLGLAAILFA